MYDYIDRPVAQLGPGSRFLIWSMRNWAHAMRGDTCPASAIAPAFAKWRMIGGLQAFHRTMLLLNRDALEPFRFCSPSCSHVAEHEAILLSLIGRAGGESLHDVRDTLALIIEEDSIGDLLQSLVELARAMTSAMMLPGTPAPPRA